MSRTLFRFEDAHVDRLGTGVVFKGLNWSVRENETWAVVGVNGSGKTTLAETLLGQHRLATGSLSWPALKQDGVEPATAVKYVPFRENSRLFSPADYYYQQRFDFGDPPDCPTAGEYIAAGSKATQEDIHAVAARLGVANQLGQKLITLSTGQMRRTRLARALITKPKLLILDDPFCGLDTAGRAELDRILATLVGSGTQLLLVTNDGVPGWNTNVLVLPGRRRPPGLLPPSDSVQERLPAPDRNAEHSDMAIELRDVNVRHGGKIILNGVNWTVRVGDRWALVGPNGSGKTTLLSLVVGDHPAAYSNHVRLFGKQRGSGETIWDVKRQIGLVSPELHQYFTVPMTAFDAAATGWHDVLTPRDVTESQGRVVADLFRVFGLTAFQQTPFSRLSTGLQRLVLFIRAVVKKPPLVILDEPFQALDAGTSARLRDWLDEHLEPRQTLIMVSHREGDFPKCITKVLRLKNGEMDRTHP